MDDYETIDNISEAYADAQQEVKINPQFFIHQAIIKAQNVLVNSEYKEGILKYVAIIRNAEIIAVSSGLVGDDYDKEIEEAEKRILKEKAEDTLSKLHQRQEVANVKLSLIMRKISSMQSKKGNLELKDD